MPKVKLSSISKEEKSRLLADLFDVVYGLKSKQKTIDLLVGLLTPSESLMLARRIQIAKQLINGNTYEGIKEDLEVGYQTISGVEQWLNARDGAYRKVLMEWISKSRKKDIANRKEYGDKSLLDRYPQHRFLKDLLGL